MTMIPREGPVEHIRNALMIIRCVLDHGAPMLGNQPAIVVRIADLARLQARLECAAAQLEVPNDEQRHTDWSSAKLNIKRTGGAR